MESGVISKTPDHDFFVHLAKTYTKENKHMNSGGVICKEEKYKDGITNGAEWYEKLKNQNLYF